jgi:predicted deacylase
MSTLQIAGHDLVPGKTIKDHIHVGGTTIRVPHILISGDPAGPTLLITAGIHNAEFVGIQAAIELSREIDPETIKGNVIIVPLANTSGFENRTMSMVYEDGRNLNRVFPGDRYGTAAYRLAHMLFNTFIVHADAYIDLHSGDGYEELTPYVYYVGDTAVEEQSAAMAACVNTEYCVKSRCLTGGAYNLASVNGVPSVLIERGQLSQMPRDQVEQDKADVLNIMKHMGILEGKASTYDKQLLRETEMFSPASGCWYPVMHAGDSFTRGDRLGLIKDYFGEIVHEIVAPENGMMLHQTASLNIIEKGPMISYGVPDHSGY